ncbi:MAG TPA: SMC family ATPase, partial [Microlunatus sp.]|nr:SMC family ATPase [Microlunatus sp.]
MRPVRLDLDGFASFRDPAGIDFTDADYFAFVGPTGSGKSTVIDALTFALYGSAPRWGRETSNQYALAPTANRCTVRLVFDVAGERYVVAREVRRSGSAIQQKSCTLERYLDPAATGDVLADEPTESLAGDPRSVKARVIELLGLEFDDFCTCVVLPQGEFQTFLKATAAERQAILLKLIGGRHYDAIGKVAGRQARDAEARVDALTAQLAEYADATKEAAQQAAHREAELEQLVPAVDDAVARVRELLTRQGAAAAVTETLTAEVARLEAIRPPEGVDELQAGLAAALAAYRSAQEREARARTTAANAQRAVETGPQRRPLEEALRHDAERTDCVARLPALETAVEVTESHRAHTMLAARTAEEQVEQLRRDHAAAVTATDRAAAGARDVENRIATYADVAVPSGVVELADRSAAAQRRYAQAETDVARATAALEAAGATLAALPERSALEELDRALDAYAESLTTETALEATSRSLDDQIHRAGDRSSAAAARRDAALEQLDQLRTRSVAADLRPRLQVGDPCPVCDQTVAVLPPALAAPELDAARSALGTVEQELADAQHERQQAE